MLKTGLVALDVAFCPAAGDAHLSLRSPTLLKNAYQCSAPVRSAPVRQRTTSGIENAGIARLDTLLRALVAPGLELVVRLRTKSSAHDIEGLF